MFESSLSVVLILLLATSFYFMSPVLGLVLVSRGLRKQIRKIDIEFCKSSLGRN